MPQIVLLLGTGLLFTLAMKCTQIRMIPTMIKLLFSGKKSEHGLSSFQAFTLAIAGRVGVGNIAGVATAWEVRDLSFGCGSSQLSDPLQPS